MLQITTPRSSTDLTGLNSGQGIDLSKIGMKEIPVDVVLGAPITPDLSAIFKRETINSLLNVSGCVGIRLYPAIKEDELVLIATCVDSGYNDMNESNGTKCACGYSNPLVQSHEETVIDSKKFILATDLEATPTLEDLQFLQTVDNSPNQPRRFKAFFSLDFFKNNNFFVKTGETGPPVPTRVRFDVAELKFFGDNKTKRTIAATFLDIPSTTTSASLLPCPPNCGGDYTEET